MTNTRFIYILIFSFLSLTATSIRASAQDETLLVKEIIPYNARANALRATAVQMIELRSLLARTSRDEGFVYSANGRLEARLSAPTAHDQEDGSYSAQFYDRAGRTLGQFADLSGQIQISNDGMHFITSDKFSGILSFYSLTTGRRTAKHRIRHIRDVVLSESGRMVLVASLQERNILLSCFDIEGRTQWSREIDHAAPVGGALALSRDGRRSALAAFVIDPANDAFRAERKRILTERKQRIAEARRAWITENRRRRTAGLPPIPFTRPGDLPAIPHRRNTKALTWGQTPTPRSSLLLLDQDGNEIRRTDLHYIPFLNLTFAGKSQLFLAASRGSEVHLFDGMTGLNRTVRSLERHRFEDTAAEIYGLDLNTYGEVAVAAVIHPTKRQGRFIDRGLDDPRVVFFFDAELARRSQYTFPTNLQIPLREFVVKIGTGGKVVLARAADSIYILGL